MDCIIIHSLSFISGPDPGFGLLARRGPGPGSRHHPNFSWKNGQSATPEYNPQRPSNFGAYVNPQHNTSYAPQAQNRSLEESLNTLIQSQRQFMQSLHNIQQIIQNNQQAIQNNQQVIQRLETSVEQIKRSLQGQGKGTFPAQPLPNPKGQFEVSDVTNPNYQEHVQAVALRSGKELQDIPKKHKQHVSSDLNEKIEKEKGSTNAKTVVDIEKGPDPMTAKPVAPFPLRLTHPRQKIPNQEILDVFKEVRINIPLLDAIKQVPTYAKFLKDLCTAKRRVHVPKKAFLTEQVSAYLTQTTPPKYKDPGCPTISCVIGNHRIGQALLDLGASVNLLPYSVYEQLGLGELKPTRTTLQLADRSIKKPRGVIEDILVQIEHFYFPVDFYVLDTEPVRNESGEISVILGRTFLATSNALINCRSGRLKLSFGNMTLDLDIFQMCKQTRDCETDYHDVDFIDTMVVDDLEECINSHVALLLTGEDMGYLEDFQDDTVEDAHAVWKPHFEELVPSGMPTLPSQVNPPKPELKPLPSNLRYAYLGDDETYPVVISLLLTEDQEGQLLKILKQHKSAIA
ncbi:Retrotransposon gag protein [Cinnamomum micranthum f. kanehirae]|uniref:Retrotransposon gag protein n=1 Tax=Cinnamomum micranthum f. kanehirae TaxID=337451 RepID=A0A443NNQ6_9MAGN|nr:Retrotransposon gag protein [Cinnamomum micranthum f. kanehirae]